jgi:hypothetical protein
MVRGSFRTSVVKRCSLAVSTGSTRGRSVRQAAAGARCGVGAVWGGQADEVEEGFSGFQISDCAF